MKVPMDRSVNNHVSADLLDMTTEIVTAYVSKHKIELKDFPGLSRQVHACLSSLIGNATPHGERPECGVSIEESIQNDYIICFEDGKKLKLLKRHLRTFYNMTPEQYRQRWNLPFDYPMVAPNYAKKRSSLALQIGLGQKKKDPVAA
jgi:predicted transcriptional regulator